MVQVSSLDYNTVIGMCELYGFGSRTEFEEHEEALQSQRTGIEAIARDNGGVIPNPVAEALVLSGYPLQLVVRYVPYNADLYAGLADLERKVGPDIPALG